MLCGEGLTCGFVGAWVGQGRWAPLGTHREPVDACRPEILCCTWFTFCGSCSPILAMPAISQCVHRTLCVECPRSILLEPLCHSAQTGDERPFHTERCVRASDSGTSPHVSGPPPFLRPTFSFSVCFPVTAPLGEL